MYPAAVGDEQIIDSVENDTYPSSPNVPASFSHVLRHT